MRPEEINIIPNELGLKLGYEDYRGEFLSDKHELIATWNYDKRQDKYLSSIGKKRFYARSVPGLINQIKKHLSALNQ